MKHISVLIKPSSSLCNIRCKYCFYADVSSLRKVKSFGKMTLETAQKMIVHIYADLEDGDTLTLAFQGGEPTLAGLDFFESIVSFIKKQKKKINVQYSIQTNGILINENWCHFLKKNQFLVGLSLDILPSQHNLNRIDTKGLGTFDRVMQTKTLFDSFGIEYNILCVLTNQLAKESKKIFQFLKEHHIQYIQFIPCLDDLMSTHKNDFTLTPQQFSSFYKQIFSLWLEELKIGNYISIKLFDDIFNLFVLQKVTACGILGNCQIQYVIEADGSVYPCDFYVLDEYRLGYIQEQTLKELFSQSIATSFLCAKQETSHFCNQCPFYQACRGGCKRMRDTIYVTSDENFCGYQELLKIFVPKLNEIIVLLQNI